MSIIIIENSSGKGLFEKELNKSIAFEKLRILEDKHDKRFGFQWTQDQQNAYVCGLKTARDLFKIYEKDRDNTIIQVETQEDRE